MKATINKMIDFNNSIKEKNVPKNIKKVANCKQKEKNDICVLFEGVPNFFESAELKSKDTQKMFLTNKDEILIEMGKILMYDLIIGNYDRFFNPEKVEGINSGNILFLKDQCFPIAIDNYSFFWKEPELINDIVIGKYFLDDEFLNYKIHRSFTKITSTPPSYFSQNLVKKGMSKMLEKLLSVDMAEVYEVVLKYIKTLPKEGFEILVNNVKNLQSLV